MTVVVSLVGGGDGGVVWGGDRGDERVGSGVGW